MNVKALVFGVMLVVVLGNACPSPLAFAATYEDAFRCGTDVILLGDSKFRVGAKCGSPAAKEYVGNNYLRGFPANEVRDAEEWTYNRGPTDFVYILRFHGGTLTEIYRSGRGF